MITGSFGGNLNVTVAGSGFVSSVMVRVCDREAVVSDVTSSSLTFLTPDFSDGKYSAVQHTSTRYQRNICNAIKLQSCLLRFQC